MISVRRKALIRKIKVQGRETHSDSSVITTAVRLDLVKRMTTSLSRSSETRERIKDGSSE